MPKKLLTNKKKAWVRQFRPTASLRGTTLNYNAGIQTRYDAKLQRLVNYMAAETENKIKALYKKSYAKKYFAQDASISSQARILMNELFDRFTKIFDERAKPMAESMVKESTKASASVLNSSLRELSGGLSIKTKFMTGPLKDIAKAVVSENVSLIKSIPQQYLTQIEGAVMRSITTGQGLKDLIPYLEKQKGVTKRRAKNIALDQTRKAYNGINRSRMETIGIREFEWLHSGGGQHPREEHIEMSGNIYSLDDPPVIDSKTGERGFPGDAINCKCTMRPIVSFEKGKLVE